MTSFIYPRTISVYRQKTTSSVGDRGYSAERGPTDVNAVIAGGAALSGLSASIQLDRQGQHNQVGLPTDAAHATVWKIFIPKSEAALGSIKTTDIVIDDTGVAYQVFGPYWNSLGYQLRCTLLEV